MIPPWKRLVPAVTRDHVDPVIFARKVSRLVLDLIPSPARSTIMTPADAQLGSPAKPSGEFRPVSYQMTGG